MIIILIIAIIELITIRKYNHLGMFFFLLNLSVGAILNSLLMNATSILTLWIFLILYFFRLKKGNLGIRFYWRNVIFLALISLLHLLEIYSFNGFLNTVYVLIIVPSICEFSMFFMKENKIDFIDFYSKYLFINMLILFYRATIDYTFWGYAVNVDLYQLYADYYTSFGFRPANLSSAIIFSIEIVIGMYLLLCKKGFNTKSTLFFVLGLISLIFMRSRSSLILLLLFVIYVSFFSSKKTIMGRSVLVVSLVVFSYFATVRYGLLDLITFSERSYLGRFSSITTTVSVFNTFDIVSFFFGKGMGTANRMIDGTMTYYVENFFVALLVDLGIIGLTAFLWVLLTTLYQAIKRKRFHCAIVIIGICIVNLVSSNLTSYMIQGLLWILVLYVKSNKEDSIYESSFSWIKR